MSNLLMSTEWLTVDGSRLFELYVEDEVLSLLGEERILKRFGPRILSETRTRQLKQALARVARDIDVVLAWTEGPTHEDPQQRRLTVTLLALRHPK